MFLIEMIATSVPCLILYVWAFALARRHRRGRAAAYSLAARGLTVLAAGELLRVGVYYHRLTGGTFDASTPIVALQSMFVTSLAQIVLVMVPPLVGTYMLVRAIFAPPNRP